MNELKEELKSLQNMHVAISGALMLVLIILYFISTPTDKTLLFDISPLGGMAVLLGLGGNGIFELYYRTELKKIRLEKIVGLQFAQYRKLQVFRFASLELAGLLSGIVYFLNGNLLLIIIGLVFTLVLLSYRPTTQRIEEDLGLIIEE